MPISEEFDTLSLRGVVIKLTPAIIKFLIGTQYEIPSDKKVNANESHTEQLGFTNMFPTASPDIAEEFNKAFN